MDYKHKRKQVGKSSKKVLVISGGRLVAQLKEY